MVFHPKSSRHIFRDSWQDDWKLTLFVSYTGNRYYGNVCIGNTFLGVLLVPIPLKQNSP